MLRSKQPCCVSCGRVMDGLSAFAGDGFNCKLCLGVENAAERLSRQDFERQFLAGVRLSLLHP